MHRPSVVARVAVLAVSMVVMTTGPAVAEEAAAPAATTDLIVAFHPDAATADITDVVGDAAVMEEQTYDDSLATVSVAAEDVTQVVAELNADPRVAYVERDVQAHVVALPSDPYYPQQWGVPLTQVPAAWDVTTGSSAVVIAVIDTGVSSAHADLSGVTYVAGHDFVNDDDAPEDDHGHGTAATGVIASQHNGMGAAGICPSCRIMPLKAMGANGSGSHGAIAAAIHHAVDNGADIINLSLGSESSTSTLQTAVRRAHDAGVLVVAAAGNAGVETPFYPAAYDEVLGVAASDQGDRRYSWSNSGDWVSVAAPGCNVAAAYDPETGELGYESFCGTSSAAPFTAGIAGLLASARPGVSGAALSSALQSSARSVSFVTDGRVNATAALAALATGEPPLPPDDDVIPPAPDDAGDPDADTPVDSATSVSSSAASLSYGQSVEILGRVSTSAGTAQGAMVTLLSRPAGEAAWAELAEQPVDAAGTVLFTREPLQTADYRLRFDGSSVQASSLSDIVTIAVRPVVTATTAPEPVLAGKPAVVTGSIVPAGSDTAVALQRRTADGWRQVATGTTNRDGEFRLAAPARVGRTRYRVHAAETTTLAAETSAAVDSVGERVALPAVRPDARGVDGRNLNGEFLVLRNTGATRVQLRGWSVRSASTGKSFRLPSYRLPAGATVKIHSGRGDTRRGHVHLGAGREVWRNGRDTAVVRHPSGPVAARVSW